MPIYRSGNWNIQHSRAFSKRWTGQSIPDESIIRNRYLPVGYQCTVNRIREKVGTKDFYVEIDERTDANARCLMTILIGTLDNVGKPYIVEPKEVEKTNSTQESNEASSLPVLWAYFEIHDPLPS